MVGQVLQTPDRDILDREGKWEEKKVERGWVYPSRKEDMKMAMSKLDYHFPDWAYCREPLHSLPSV